MTQESREETRAKKVDTAIKLSGQCQKVLRMREFMEMIQEAIETADALGDKTIGQEHDRHVGGKKFGRDLIETIKRASKFVPPDTTKKAAPPQYE